MDFSQFSIILAIVGLFSIIAKLLKQPLIIAYIFSGLFLAITGLVGDLSSLESFGNIGVALLLFLLGIEMNLEEVPAIGKTALFTGIGQIVFTSTIGFFLARLLGFPTTPSLYMAIALTFSSTIIMVKLLSEKKDLTSLYGRIAIGFLLVQDVVAIVILMLLSGLGSESNTIFDYGFIFAKALFLFFGVWLLSKKVLPVFFNKIISSSTELLFLISITWALGVSAFVAGPLGFSLEVGGFLAGIALSNLPSHLQISSRMKPMRDFFLVIFFLLLGSKLVVTTSISSLLVPALVFSFFVLVGNPIIVLTIMGFLGYKKRTSFFAGLTVAQISEFSLVIMAMGETIGHLENTHVSIVVIVGIITMTLSTYLILGSEKIYKLLASWLSVFERKKTKESAFITNLEMSDHVVLVGSDKTGRELLPFFQKANIPLVVVDFNPAVYNRLVADNIPVVFGDINDIEVFDSVNVSKAKLVVSTTSNLTSNLALLESIRLYNNNPITFFTASLKTDALRLYEAGATYVIVPEIVAGDYIKHLLSVYKTSYSSYHKLGKKHFKKITFHDK